MPTSLARIEETTEGTNNGRLTRDEIRQYISRLGRNQASLDETPEVEDAVEVIIPRLDYDGDGDLDIVAGGYSMWTPEGRKLNAEEEARAAELSATVKRLNEESSALFEKIWDEIFKATVNLDPESEEHEEIVDSINDKYESETTASREKLSAAQAELEELVPSPKRVSYVWLYERL